MSGCNNCPAFAKCTAATYRGSQCSALRASYGLGDPRTNADRIRAMSDEEMANFMILSPEMEFDVCCFCRYGNTTTADDRGHCLTPYSCDGIARAEAFRKWLQQPCEDSPTVEKG